ncbi:hypothetical protein SAMN05192570_1707 [Brevundimonas viscosa]|uniref:DUF2946 domain-containing protein n=1 Tax=Brevundimonas viscosa TaxID=871741 RepID=A0A1I6QD78_9CAUL|nr:hypothetical protein SAMN05192570_1707 [Brevundimonas viscosa]
MTRGWRQSAGFAAALPALLLMLVLRGLVAPGYMPGFDAGGFRIVVCEDQAPPAPAMAHSPAAHDDHGGEDESTRREALCAFAGVGPELAPEAPPPTPRWPFAVTPPDPVRPARLVRIDGPSEGPPPPARAPPLAV